MSALPAPDTAPRHGPAGRPATRPLAALAAGALLASALTACTSNQEGAAGATGAARSVADADRSRLAEGGTVTWGVDAMPRTLNAFQHDAGPVTDRIAGAVLPILFTLDSRGRPQLNEDYLRSAEITDREPKQKVVYTLHPDAEWSNGRRIQAADFAAQFEALSGEDASYTAARNAGYDRIEKVTRGPGARQVEVTFDKPYADWRSLFTPLYPKEATGDAHSFNDGTRTKLPATGGPFALEDVDRKADTVTLVRNDAWWGEPALLDELEFTAVPRGRRAAALSEGTLDVAEVTPALADRITEADGGDGKGRGSSDGLPETPAPAAALHAWARARLAQEQTAADGDRSGEDSGGGNEGGGESGDGAAAAAAAARTVFVQTLAAAQRAQDSAFAAREEAERAHLAGYTVHRAYAPAYTQLALNGTSEVLSDERVRWAVAGALEREELARLVHEPAGLPVKPLGSHLRMPDQEGYRDSSVVLGGEDFGSASELLAEAGWRAGDTESGAGAGNAGDGAGRDGAGAPRGQAAPAARTKAGEELTLRFVLPTGPGTGQLRKVGRHIAEMLAQEGIKAEITEVEDEVYLSNHVMEGDFDLALYSWPATAFPATEARPLFTKPQAIPGGKLFVGQNYSRIGTDYIDQLLREAAAELDEKAREELLDEADTRIWAAAGSIPLYQRPELVAAKSDLAGVGAFGMQTPRYQDIGYRA